MSSEEQQPGPGDAAISETDSRSLRGKGQAVSNVYISCPVAPDPDAEEYNMAHSRRGMALIFNHANFRNLAPRNGTDKDCAALAKALKRLDFEVQEYRDLTCKQLKDKLDEVADYDHTEADCLLIAVLSHGDTGIVHATDHPYPVQQLWNPFLGDKCRTLAGKPKIFIIQACRGEEVDRGVRVRTQTDSSGGYYTIPAHSDILVAFSTVEGYYSWRNPSEGSWFIQALVEELKENGRKRDLQTLLTFVGRRVAVGKMSFVPNDPHMDQKKQASAFMSTLTRLVFFR
ncbi:caspase isoform X2 [Anabrus simplex]